MAASKYPFVNAEAAAYVAAMTTKPNRARKAVIDTFFTDLKSAVSLSKFDAFYLFAAHTSQAALLNAINPGTYNGTATSSPTFTADAGYTGNGTSAYIDTGAQIDSLSAFAQNSAHLGVYELTNIGDGSDLAIGDSTSDEVRINTRNGVDLIVARVNQTTSQTESNTSSIGHFVANRSGASATQIYKNGSSLGSDTQSSAALNAENIYILSAAGTFSNRQIAVAHFGASLTAGEVSGIRSALVTYLTAVGAI